MDIIRREVLEEMVRNGHGYRHEVKSVAEELLARRRGEDPAEFDGIIVRVPRILLVQGYDSAVYIRSMKIGDTKLVRFEPFSGKHIYAAVHRMPDP